jgi:hypothetical protein
MRIGLNTPRRQERQMKLPTQKLLIAALLLIGAASAASANGSRVG